ncbi:hypothetical protein JW777_05350 [bacterium]|nr:hypothetical protein [bacterium]
MALQKREKNMLIYGGGGVALLLVLNFLGVFDGKEKNQEPAKTTPKTAGQAVKTADQTVKTEAVNPVPMDTSMGRTWGGRDPFSKPQFDFTGRKTVEAAPIRVKGIVWMSGKPYILINDVVLAVGEEKNGIRVDRIEGNKVYARKGGKMYTLQWSESP